MIITVSGLFGSGKSTAAKLLAKQLKLKYFCAGKIMRKDAEKTGMSLIGFETNIAEKDPEYDQVLDEQQRKAAEKGNVVIDSRLGAWMVPQADLKIWLVAPLETRAKRVAKRDKISVDEARKRIISRDASDMRRYAQYYQIDVSDTSAQDLVINTETFRPEQITKLVQQALKILAKRK